MQWNERRNGLRRTRTPLGLPAGPGLLSVCVALQTNHLIFFRSEKQKEFLIFLWRTFPVAISLPLSLSLTLSLCRLWVTTRLSEAREIYAFLRLCKPWFFHPRKSIIKFMVFSPWDFSLAAAFLLLLIPTSKSNKCISYLVYGICLVYLVLCSISFFFFVASRICAL